MILIDGEQLTISQVVAVARNDEQVRLAAHAKEHMLESYGWVQSIIAAGRPVYGINTGFGIFADQRISPADSNRLTRNLILSHAVATGPALPAEVVRAAMLIRANTLARGNSGVRPAIIDTLLAMLDQDVTPIIPSQGSLGSSGDLAPLSAPAPQPSFRMAERWREGRRQVLSSAAGALGRLVRERHHRGAPGRAPQSGARSPQSIGNPFFAP